jgi:hypothetical protein
MAYDDEDWIKGRVWDVRNADHTLVTTLDQLCGPYLSVQKVKDWQNLTCWNAAPDSLKAEADAYIKDNEYGSS